MTLALTLPSFRVRPAEHSSDAPATVVLNIEDESRYTLGSLIRHWPRTVGDPLAFDVVDIAGELALRMVRPYPAGMDGRRVWTVSDATGARLADVSVKSRIFGERLSLQVSEPVAGGRVLADLRSRRLPESWQLVMAAGEIVPIRPTPDGFRPIQLRSVDLSALATHQRPAAMVGALVAVLVYCAPTRPSVARQPFIARTSDQPALQAS